MKVGDYVRTPQGIIAKIIDIQEDTGQYFLNGNAVSLESKNYISDKNITIGENFKHSPNIIDLIEVGDVITTNNLCGEITKIDGDKIYTTCYDGEYCSASDIKTIVTHEQFKSMEYEVK